MKRILLTTGLIFGSSLAWADAAPGLSADAPEVTVSPPAVTSTLKPSATGPVDIRDDEVMLPAGRTAAQDRSRHQRAVRLLREQLETKRANQ